MNNQADISELIKAIDDWLFKNWDPIGIKDIPEAKGEYVLYAEQIAVIIVNTADATKIVQEIARHLEFAINTSIGLKTTYLAQLAVSRRLIEGLGLA